MAPSAIRLGRRRRDAPRNRPRLCHARQQVVFPPGAARVLRSSGLQADPVPFACERSGDKSRAEGDGATFAEATRSLYCLCVIEGDSGRHITGRHSPY